MHTGTADTEDDHEGSSATNQGGKMSQTGLAIVGCTHQPDLDEHLTYHKGISDGNDSVSVCYGQYCSQVRTGALLSSSCSLQNVCN